MAASLDALQSQQQRQTRQHSPVTSAPLPLPGWPLLHLPRTAQRTVVAQLAVQNRRSLRLACPEAAQLVNECTTHLQLDAGAFCSTYNYLGVLSMLRHRFPSVITLTVSGAHGSGDSSSSTNASAQAQWVVESLLQDGPWSSIQHLEVSQLSSTCTALLAAGCPNLTAFCSAWSPHGSIDSDTLAALARSCTALVELHVYVGRMSEEGLAVLVSMQTLTSLQLTFQHVPDTAWDLSTLSQLQSLRLDSYTEPTSPKYDPIASDEEDEVMQQEQLAPQPYTTMRLPPSLTTAHIPHIPVSALPLPYLTELVLYSCTATDEHLALLAAGCPQLTSLELCGLLMTAKCHATPLRALQSLHVHGSLLAGAGVHIAGAFPAVKALTLRCSGGFMASAELFQGAIELVSLDMGSGWVDGWQPGLHLPVTAFSVLAGLPSLAQLRLNADSEHAVGVGKLAQLTSITWIVAAD